MAGALACAAVVRPRAKPSLAQAELVQQALPNGLVVIVQQRESADTVALLHANLAGWRDDGAIPGSTVLTSHMLLQGTQSRPSDIALQHAATLAGGSLDRGTTVDYSFIGSVMPASAAEVAFDLVSDVLLNPLFDPAALDDQKQTTLGNMAERRSDPGLLMGDLFQETLFAGQALGNPPLGTPDSVAAMTAETMQATWQRLWGAANGVVTVAGKIQPEDAFDLAASYFGPLFSGSANVRQPTQIQPPASPKTVQGAAGQQVQFRIGFMAPDLAHDDRYPIAVLTGIMSGFSGRLLRELRTNRGIAYTPFASYETFSDAGLWYASATVDPGNLEEALDVTKTEIQRLSDELADPAEVSDAITEIAGGKILATESNESLAAVLANEQILGDVSLDEFVRRVQLVTPADVRRVAQSYLDLNHSLTALVGPASS